MRKTAHLNNIFSVLCSILENHAAVLQVFFIQTERLSINLLQGWIPELCLLQVNQEVTVDWTTLNETESGKKKQKYTTQIVLM